MMNKNKFMQIANFIEELDWLIKSKKNIDLKETAMILRNIESYNNKNVKNLNTVKNKKSELVGILPALFQDKDLFQKNKDIIEFAENLFNIKISRPDKRTRYELVGLIVTEIDKLNKKELINVVDALSIVSSDINKMKQLKKAKKEDINFSWNLAISKMNK